MIFGAKAQIDPHAKINLDTPLGTLLSLQDNSAANVDGVDFQTILNNATQGIGEQNSNNLQSTNHNHLAASEFKSPSTVDEYSEISLSLINHIDEPAQGHNSLENHLSPTPSTDEPAVNIPQALAQLESSGPVNLLANQIISTPVKSEASPLDFAPTDISIDENQPELNITAQPQIANIEIKPLTSQKLPVTSEITITQDESPLGNISLSHNARIISHIGGHNKSASNTDRKQTSELIGTSPSQTTPISIDARQLSNSSNPQELEVAPLTSATIINTTLPLNSSLTESMQQGNVSMFSSGHSFAEAREQNNNEPFEAKTLEAIAIGDKSFRTFAQTQKISEYKDSELPLDDREKIINKQVIKVLNNLENKTQTITVQLDPEHLGKIDIRMEITPKGETKVLILADKLETYSMLTKSSEQIQGVLNDKGFNGDSSSLNFGLRYGNGGNNPQQNTDQQFTMNEFGSEIAEEEIGNMRNATLLYSDPDRVNIMA